MALDRTSKLSEICGNEEAYTILQKHVPSIDKNDPRMACKALLAFPQTKCPKDVREAFYAELEAANIG